MRVPAPGLILLAAVLIAFRVSYRRGEIAERVQVDADHVRVLRRTGGRERPVWTSPTAFTRVAVHRRGRDAGDAGRPGNP